MNGTVDIVRVVGNSGRSAVLVPDFVEARFHGFKRSRSGAVFANDHENAFGIVFVTVRYFPVKGMVGKELNEPMGLGLDDGPIDSSDQRAGVVRARCGGIVLGGALGRVGPALHVLRVVVAIPVAIKVVGGEEVFDGVVGLLEDDRCPMARDIFTRSSEADGGPAEDKAREDSEIGSAHSSILAEQGPDCENTMTIDSRKRVNRLASLDPVSHYAKSTVD